jgi:phosphoglucosamine mutase
MSASFKYFGTDGIRGKVGTYPITAEFMLKLGWATGRVLVPQGAGNILIGKDTRVSGYMFEAALEAGLSAAGVNVSLLGPMPTPGVAYLTRTLRANAGVMISASHNPYYDNGIKFFSADGGKIHDAIALAIEKELDTPFSTVDSKVLGRAVRLHDAPARYIEFCKHTIPYQTQFEGLRIVIDCANGATYHIAPHVFRELGVAEVIQIHNKPDGLNINLECGATNLTSLQKTVLEKKADLGIAFDGDGDRVMMVDHTGRIVDGDEILYVMAKAYQEKGELSGGVVGTVMTNLGVELGLKKLGIPLYRAQVGDRYVAEAMAEKGWNVGGESSGHLIFSNLTTTGDGIISAVQMLNTMQMSRKSLHELVKPIEKTPQKMINVKVAHQRDPLEIPEVAKAVKSAQDKLSEQGRILIRCSGTEPLIRVMVEGQNAAQVQQTAEELAQVVRHALG